MLHLILVSVIIPVYNGERYIKKIYNSLKKQKYKNVEIIFWDDASTDKSLELLKNIKSKTHKIKVYHSDINCGPGGSKNEGLKKADGDYVIFLDCDDYISDDYISDLVDNAIENDFPDLVLSNFTKVNENNKVKYIRDYKNKENAFFQKISSVGKLYKKTFLINNNLSLPYGKVLEDVLFHTAIVMSKPKFSYSNTCGYYYVYNESSISHTTLKKFNEGSLNNAINYLILLKSNKNLNLEDLDYYSFKYVCWYLLKSGNNVGTKNMLREYDMGFSFLKKEFPKYNNIKKILNRNERVVIKFVLFSIAILNKMHIDRYFFKFYGSVNLEKFWPNL